MFPRTPLVPLSVLLRALPDTLHTELLARLFNHLLRGQYLREQLVDLDGKRLAIGIKDTGNNLLFRVRGNRFVREGRGGQGDWDVRISGRLEDFWVLATRAEDPDTLFFNRRLAIEGETETGLYLKNLLDALDFDREAHLEEVFGPRLAHTIARVIDRTGIEPRIRRLITG